LKDTILAMKEDLQTRLSDMPVNFGTTAMKRTYAELLITDHNLYGSKKSIEWSFNLKGLNVTVEGLVSFLTIDDLLIDTYNPSFTNKPNKFSITDGVYYFLNEDEDEVEIDNDNEEKTLSKVYRIVLEIL